MESDLEMKRRELAELNDRVRRLEAEVASLGRQTTQWPPVEYYTAYHMMTGLVLGMFGSLASLVFNMVGSLLVGKHPLELIKVYLTFPLGQQALDAQQENNLVLAVGCCLYIGTGMLFGVPFNLILTRWFADSSLGKRFVVASGLGIALWLINFYGILSWLQPELFGGRWIVDTIPPAVAALTHLVFAWTMLLVQPLGRFVPYQHPAEDR